MRRALPPLALLAVAACSATPTEILVVTDTNVVVPSQVDFLHVVITGPDGRMQTADADLSMGDVHLPRTTRMVHETGPLGPFLVHAVALHGGASGAMVVDRTARVSFVEGRLVVLRLDLLASCIGVGCGADMTCAEGGCRPVDVAAGELTPWQGMVPPHLDGGAATDGAPGDACDPSRPEVCNGLDDNCNGQVDETTDLRTDPDNCGGCGHRCTDVANGSRSCVLGVCQVVCDATHQDCDGMYGNGCERSIATPTDCAACNLACMVAHGTASCTMGACTLASCMPGWDSCDRVAGTPDLNGCETNVDANPDRCGSCTNACPTPPHATPTCAGSVCGFVCDAGWADCVGAPGCESNLSDPGSCGDCATHCMGGTPYCSGTMLSGSTCVADCTLPLVRCGSSCIDTTQSPQNCSACGSACPSVAHSAPTCTSSTCGFLCDTGYADCDGMASTGCEASLRDVATCGSCTTRCAPPHATPACGDGTCSVGSCDAGYADCNGLVDDGCEVHVAVDASHCGSCTTTCPAAPAHAIPTCGASGCGLACDSGFGDCDGMASTGCETDLGTSSNCGSCGTSCASPAVCQSGGGMAAACVTGCGGAGDPTHMLCGGACVDVTTDLSNCLACGNVCPSPAHASATCLVTGCGIGCATGFDDCDGMTSTGCETDTTSTPTACGSCTNVCPTGPRYTATCSGGTCGIRCVAPYADCNPMMGCETMLGTRMACLGCGDVCPAAAPHAAMGAMCTGTGCRLTCDTGRWDCDGALANGCEVHAQTAPNACAACGAACTSGQVCCGLTCVTGTTCP